MLRRALEEKPRPESPLDPLTSVDETATDRILRLLEIARLAAACRADLWDAARRGESDTERAESMGRIHREISELATELRAAIHRVSAMADESLSECERLHAIVEKPVRPPE